MEMSLELVSAKALQDHCRLLVQQQIRTTATDGDNVQPEAAGRTRDNVKYDNATATVLAHHNDDDVISVSGGKSNICSSSNTMDATRSSKPSSEAEGEGEGEEHNDNFMALPSQERNSAVTNIIAGKNDTRRSHDDRSIVPVVHAAPAEAACADPIAPPLILRLTTWNSC